jgi:hypothetical protein
MVVDKHPEALKEDELPFWRSPDQIVEVPLRRAWW